MVYTYDWGESKERITLKMEEVMLGNAAAAIQGAPVTTMDIDFCIRDDAGSIEKLKGIANELNGDFFDYYLFLLPFSPP